MDIDIRILYKRIYKLKSDGKAYTQPSRLRSPYASPCRIVGGGNMNHWSSSLYLLCFHVAFFLPCNEAPRTPTPCHVSPSIHPPALLKYHPFSSKPHLLFPCFLVTLRRKPSSTAMFACLRMALVANMFFFFWHSVLEKEFCLFEMLKIRCFWTPKKSSFYNDYFYCHIKKYPFSP